MLSSDSARMNFKVHLIPSEMRRLVNDHGPLYIVSKSGVATSTMRSLLKADSLIDAVWPQEAERWLHCISLLLEEPSGWISSISVYIRGHIVQDHDHQVELVCYLLQVFRMLKQEVWSFNKVYLTISLDKVVTDGLNIVDDNKFDSFIFNPLR